MARYAEPAPPDVPEFRVALDRLELQAATFACVVAGQLSDVDDPWWEDWYQRWRELWNPYDLPALGEHQLRAVDQLGAHEIFERKLDQLTTTYLRTKGIT